MNEWDPFEIRAGQFKDGKLNAIANPESLFEDWPPSHAVKEYLGVSLGKKRLGGFFAFIIALMSLIFYRAYILQIVQGDYYRNVAEGNRIRVISVKAPRGLIYDSQFRPLVKNIPNFSLVMTPADLPKDITERNNLYNEVADILQEPSIFNKLMEFGEGTPYKIAYQTFVVAENIDYNRALILKIKSSNWPGLNLEIARVRNYLNDTNNSLSHLTGYLGKVTESDLTVKTNQYGLTDQLGKAGLESSYEPLLRGVPGKEQIEVDALGKVKKLIARENPNSGSDLILTIDKEVQEKLTSTLASQLKKTGAQRAAAIALNPNNGEILAAISWPTYDNNLFARSISVDDYKKLSTDPNLPLFNRVISGEYPSGSTFKPLVAAAALEENLITKNTVINSLGGIRVNQWFFPDWKPFGHGYTNVTKAIAESVNSFFYMVGGGHKNFKGLGVSKIVRYAKEFGLGQPLGIDLEGEKSGFLPTPDWKESTKNERWYIGDTYHLAIGQGDLLVTPLQLASATAAFANGGVIYQPHLVKEIKTADNAVSIAPKIINKDFVSGDNLAIVKQGLRETVSYGSGRSLNGIGVAIAGKTGTAQWNTSKRAHAWFTGFAPYNNPEIVITVLIEEGGEGSQVSVPVAREFLDWYFNIYTKAASKLTKANVDNRLD